MPNPNPGPQNLQWLTWRDFTSGIVTRTGALAATGPAPANLGAATLTNTYRCVCLPQGGLTGLPSRTFNRSVGTQNAGTNITTGAHVIGPVIEVQSQAVPNVYPRSTSLHQAYTFVGVGGVTTAYVPSGAWKVDVHLLDSSSNLTIETINTSTAPPPAHYSAVWMSPYSLYTSTTPQWSKHLIYGWVYHSNTAGNIGATIVPPSTAPNVNTALAIGGSAAPLITMHQTRIIRVSVAVQTGIGVSQGFMATGELQPGSLIQFSAPNSLTDDTSSPLVPDNLHFVGIGAMASLTASDLLVIFVDGGAALIQGDLAAPVIRRLPNVPGTGGATVDGASTPLGFMYVQNRGGAYLWQGGDGAQLISPQLDDDFWYVTNSDVVQQHAGTLAFWRDYVLFPNNWLFDTKTQSWWQIELQSTLTYWVWRVNPLTNMLYGFVFSYQSAATNMSGWSPVTQTTNYSWQSQPFYPAEDRQVTGMELVLVAQGAGTVTFTITALDTGETDTVTVTTTGTDPKYYRENMNGVSGATLQIRAVSDGGASPAPTIHEFRLGYLVGYPVPAP